MVAEVVVNPTTIRSWPRRHLDQRWSLRNG